jgi:hypothetical protein
MLIYVLAEERSGSVWLANQIAKQLGRTHAYIETSTDEDININRLNAIMDSPIRYSDPNKVYHTHLFPILNLMDRLTEEPLVIRTSRKNTFEQLLSYYMVKNALESQPEWARVWPTDRIDNWLSGNQITLTLGEVNAFLQLKKKRNHLWDNYNSDTKQTIYYEDLYEGVKVPALNLTFSFDQSSTVEKTHYIKADHFKNYKEIKEWCDAA